MDAMNKTPGDSTSGTGYGIPDNTEAAQANLPHIAPHCTTDPADNIQPQPNCVRNTPDSTAEPVDQHDIQPQPNCVPNTPNSTAEPVDPHDIQPQPNCVRDTPDSTAEPVDQHDIQPQPNCVRDTPNSTAEPVDPHDIQPQPNCVRDSPDSTAEPVAQHDIQPQPNCVRDTPNSTAEPVDLHDIQPQPKCVRDTPNSPIEPLDPQDTQPQPNCVRDTPNSTAESVDPHDNQPQPNLARPVQTTGRTSDASAEHSDQDERPAGHNGAGRSAPPTVCNSFTDIAKTEQNPTLYHSNEEHSQPTVCRLDPHVDQAEQEQALYVGTPHVEAEELSSEDIYNTEGNADNVVQYQLSDCRKEASATVYQCGEDADVANVDRPGVETDNTNREAEDFDKDDFDKCGALPEPVVTPLMGAENSDQNKSKSEDKGNADDEFIRPYAVANQRYGHTNGGGDGDFDIQPYAVAYDEQDGHYENYTPTGRSVCGQPTAGSVTVGSNQVGLLPNPMYSGNALQQNPMYSGNALQPNPMYSGNGLRSNPMYAPNVAQPRAGGGMLGEDLAGMRKVPPP
ncbi:zinc ion binding [Branchiostoma belcheri]|nr:zinc ion binding [Branchiostoma belcheri]